MDFKQFVIQVITMSGIVGIVSGAICKIASNKVKAATDKIKAIEGGVQAILRHKLYELHEKWVIGNGYVPISVKEEFSNMYDNYHNLGANGVMDQIRDEVMGAPTSPTRFHGGDYDDCKTKDCEAH